MTEHPWDIIAEKWNEEENKFFEDQTISDNFFKLELIGNKRTGDQIEDWKPPDSEKMEELLKNWDGMNPLTLNIPERGLVQEFDDLLSENKVPIKLPEIGKMVLWKSSKVTDFIKGSFLQQYGLIINEEVISIFDKFNLGEHNYFPLEILHKERVFKNYYFFRNSATIENYIDYAKSNFYIQKGHFGFETRRKIDVKSKKDINKIRNDFSGQNIFILASKIYFTQDFPNFDLFKTDTFGIHGNFISKHLKDALQNVTGVKILKTNRIENWR